MLRRREGLLTLLGLSLAAMACTNPAIRDRRDEAAVVVLLPDEPQQIDPRLVGDSYGLKLSRLLFGSLVTVDPDTLRVRLDLAERVTQIDGRTYEACLRPGLRFSDGSSLDSEDVAATFRSAASRSFGSRYASIYARVQSIQVRDALCVAFRLREASASFVTDLELPIVRSEDEKAPVADGRDDRFPVSSGLYQLVGRGAGVWQLEVNRLHERSAVRAQPRLVFRVVRDDTTRALRLLSGGGDLALNAIPVWLVDMFSSDPRFRVSASDGVGTTYMGINLTHPVLRSRRVRKALAHAIDRSQLIETKFQGYAAMATSWVPRAHWAYDASLAASEYDPALAAQLLDHAEFADPDGAGPRARFSLVLSTSTDRFRVSVARAIAEMLRQVGVDVVVRPTELATLLSDLNRGRFEIVTLQLPEFFEPDVLRWFFSSEFIPGTHQSGGANRWRYRNPELDALLRRGVGVFTEHERYSVYQRVQRILNDDLPVIPLWHEQNIAVTSMRLREWYRAPRDGRFGTLAQ